MSSLPPESGRIAVRAFGGPTALFTYGGLRFLTDPTFDGPGDHGGPGRPVLTKTTPSTVDPATLGAIDVVLLSHDEHADNLDTSGRALLGEVPLTLTTPDAAGRLGGRLGDAVRGLADGESVRLDRPDGGAVTVTGVSAVHGPGERAEVEPLTGQVVGFVLTGDGLPTVYVSGDNASLDAVRDIAGRFAPIDTALIFAGAPRFPVLFGNRPLVLDSAEAAEAARVLDARRVVPVHYDGWAHFTEGRDDLERAFTAAGLADRLEWARESPGD
ncbi:MBL fold metallo-hydrolase [Streptomyces sp. J2-1]|uniref:MBL fold metallo-hydrolase n=1 Tax=Streptomyces corallincola TaxID=2851888 RepID=UPI001C387BEF|nr:MBL fold metallo-hydrolase [Streptomyces corallincola]MBV2353813.1 MBL fold metallo-hydrolase [Streptomyces corallincola]